MQDEPYALIPLHRQNGEVRAHTLIDEADYAAISGVSWYLSSEGYAIRNIRVALHRHLAGLELGDPREIDHVNGNPLDNRRANLRICTHAQNTQNRPSRRGSSSRHRGVSWNRYHRKWTAYVQADGTFTHLGYFTDEDEAGRAAAKAREVLLPFTVSSRDG